MLGTVYGSLLNTSHLKLLLIFNFILSADEKNSKGLAKPQVVSIPKLKRSQSEWDSPISPIVSPNFNELPSELQPAIPAMLSKAKGIIKRKLKETGSESQPITRSQSLPAESKELVVETEKERESAKVMCPLELEELGKASVRVRYECTNVQLDEYTIN